MSKKSAEEFLNKLVKDESFRRKLLKAKNSEERKKLIQAANFDFTAQDMLDVLKEKYNIHLTAEKMKQAGAKNAYANMSDEELRKVVGGEGKVAMLAAELVC